MMKIITHRFGWKLLSLALAFILWLLVVNYEDPYITRDFSNVTVEKLNATTITSQNKAIEYKSGQTVDLTLKGKRSILERLTKNDIEAYADLRNVSITGAIDIEIRVAEGIEIMTKSPADMRIAMEDVITDTREIQYLYSGEPLEGYIALEPIISPNRLQITGPESKVMIVTSVLLPIPITGAKSDVTMYVTPQLLDNNKNEVSNITVDIEKVEVKVPIQMTKTIPVVFEQMDELSEGYQLTNVESAVKEILIRGNQADLANIKELIINDIPLADKTTSQIVSIELDNYLPDGVFVVEQNTYTELNLTIDPLVEKDIIIGSQDITVRNIPDGLKFSYLDESDVVLKFVGIQEELDKVTLDSLDPYIKLLGYEAGEQEIELLYTLPSNVELISEKPLLNVLLIDEALEQLVVNGE